MNECINIGSFPGIRKEKRMMVGHEKQEGRGGRGAPKTNSGSLAALPDTGRVRAVQAGALTAGKGTGTRADAFFGNISHESPELEWIQKRLQHLEVLIFLVSPSSVFSLKIFFFK